MELKGTIILCLVLLCTVPNCTKEEQIVIPNYLFATPNSLSLKAGADTTVTLSGGKPPYVLVGYPKANIATVDTLINNKLFIHAVGQGSTSVKIGDSEATQKIAVVSIIVSDTLM